MSNQSLAFAKLIILLLIPIFFTTCKKDPIGVTMTYQQDFEIPAGLNVFDTHVFELNGIPTNKAAFFSAGSISESDITKIIPGEAALTINFANVDFYFVGEVIVEIFSREDIVGREIFYQELIPQNVGTRINLFPSLPDIKDFLTGDEFNVRIELRLRDITPQFIETRFDFQFRAQVE